MVYYIAFIGNELKQFNSMQVDILYKDVDNVLPDIRMTKDFPLNTLSQTINDFAQSQLDKVLLVGLEKIKVEPPVEIDEILEENIFASDLL